MYMCRRLTHRSGSVRCICDSYISVHYAVYNMRDRCIMTLFITAVFLMEITRDDLIDMNEYFEDIAAYYCDENGISGEKFWTVLECFAAAKQWEMAE